MECVSITVTLQGLDRCQCYFAEFLDWLVLGGELQVCILAKAIAYGAVDELNILTHGVHCWCSEFVAIVLLLALVVFFCFIWGTWGFLSEQRFLLCAGFQVFLVHGDKNWVSLIIFIPLLMEVFIFIIRHVEDLIVLCYCLKRTIVIESKFWMAEFYQLLPVILPFP